jgi:DNA gyrase subunit A
VGEVPDPRDGLDTKQRRVLAALGDEYRICADLGIGSDGYDALVALAQPFVSRYPLVDGRGNFGSVDADPGADADYTRARRAPLAHELARFPNVLVNGSGTIPPHNLREAVAAVVALLDEPEIDVAGLMARIPGPDFPTGGTLADPAELAALYETGAGTVTVRASAHVEGDSIIVTELPYGVAKGGDSGAIRRIADWHGRRSRSSGLVNLEDHSHADGMRIVLTFDPRADTGAVLDELYGATSLQTTLDAELLALAGGEPRRHTLRELLLAFVGGRDPAMLRRELEDVARRFGDDRRTGIDRVDDAGAR